MGLTRRGAALLAVALALLVVAGKAPTAAAQGPSVPDSTRSAALVADSTIATHPAPVDVRGVISDANGSPIRGAAVRLMSETDTVRVRSDGYGRFHARLTATRGVYVLVQAYGYRDLSRTFRASGRPIEAALALPPPYPLGGVAVTLSGDPLWDGFSPATLHSQLELTS